MDHAEGTVAPAELFAGRYLLGACLKSGHGATTFRAIDTRTRSDVVLKTITPGAIHDLARLRFEHETRVLRGLTGDGLVGLSDAGVADQHWYLAQPFVPGVPLDQVISRGPSSLGAALRIVLDVVSALTAAHDSGILHRDVKPANIIVNQSDPVRATLVDLGFARGPLLDDAVGVHLVGTCRYLAPEAAGMLSVSPDERADLYAVGVVLFEILAGHPPFPGTTVGEVLRHHLSTPAPLLAATRPDMPRAVDAILQRLLAKEVGDRYQSAPALAYDLRKLLDAWEGGDTDPRLVVGRNDHRRTLTDPDFVGRDAELAQLGAFVDEVGRGGSGLVLLEADSGGGKSRLLAEVSTRAAAGGLAVLRGRGVAESGARPFEVLHGLAEGLAARHEEQPEIGAALRAGLGESAGPVAQALPLLAEMLGVAADEADVGPERFGEQRSLTALRRLLHLLGDAEQPCLVVFDDLQWADRLTIQLLDDVFAEGAELPDHVGVVVAFRSEEVPPDHPLRSIRRATSVQLGPLLPAAMRQLSESMAGPLPSSAISAVVRLADGSPLMGAAVLRGLVESGALLSTPRGWSFEPGALRHVQTARRTASFLVRRLELLSPSSLSVLSAGAALGKEFDFVLATQLADETDAAAEILHDAVRRRLVWVDDVTGRCAFSHDKIREALLARLDDTERQQLHGRAADAMLALPEDEVSVFDLAYHLDAAGRHDESLPYALRSAATARAQHAFDVALSHYRMAERAVAPDDHPTRLVVAEGLGDVLTLEGSYAAAQRQLDIARTLVTDRGRQAELDGKLGALAFKQGDIATARHHLEGAMARLGRPVPRTFAGFALRLVWEVVVQVTHTLFPRLTTGRRDPSGRDEDFLAMRLHSRLAYLYWFHSGKVTCAWSHLRGLNLAERYPPSPELGQACSEHAPVATMGPLFARALRYAARSLEIRRADKDVWGQGQSQSFAGVALYAASRFVEGEEASREAIRLLETTGDQWEVNTAGWNLAMCLHRQGRLADAAEVAEGVYRSAVAIGDRTAAGVGLSVWTRAMEGDVDVRLIEAELELGGLDASTATEVRLAAGIAARHRGDLAAAAEHLEEAAATIRRAGLRQEYVAPVAAWRATVAREQAERVPVHDPRSRAAAVRAARRAVRRARWWAFSYRNNAPHALREAGLVASLSDRRRRMSRLLRRSLAVAEQQGARFEAALTRLATADVARARGGPEEAVADALAVVESCRPQRTAVDSVAGFTLSRFDRFETLLDVGRTITAAATPQAVHTAVREAALTLLRGDSCHIISGEALVDDSSTTQSGEIVDRVSRALLRRAVRSMAPVVVDEDELSEDDSAILSEVRSVLAAPIVVHGEVRFCFYVTHQRVSGLFGDEERQLAAFVATLAGAAFEHLEGTETRYHSLARNSSDVLTLVDDAGEVTYQSSAAARVFDVPVNQLVGRPVRDWVHPDDVEVFSSALERARSEGSARIECRFLHADGTFMYAETAVTDLLDDPTVQALVLNSRDITERRQLEDELRRRATHDSLTGLPNRALFLERAQQATQRRQPHPLVICFLDLDDFKTVNDTYGHSTGDLLLCELSERLVTCLRPEDTVARFGGDEFAILLEDTSLDESLRVMDRVIAATSVPIVLAGTEHIAHFSIGVAPGRPAASVDDLVAEADVAMYEAKAGGRNRYSVFRPEMSIEARRRPVHQDDVERALAGGELRLAYQSVVDVRSLETVGVEALVRWQHPERGLLSAGEFIGLAEDRGQLGLLGEWVLNQACLAARDLAGDRWVSVNVAAQQLADGALVDQVRDALRHSGLAPGRLVLEITETEAVPALEPAAEVLRDLVDLGVSVALDDFGTGHSNFEHLKLFPVTVLKIDQTFVRDIENDPANRAMVRNIADLARSLGLRTIAEGVETEEQLRLVRELGCDWGQGYLWARPTAARELPMLFPVPA
ncbi:EAL domain-containing protein [Aeromicrobium sp. NPDC092404]|uniref:EAL domain-containing protein n=1 Tax=Aeromicrobium sp. NPDC092404 TaxID=3154976 RepID=UPI003447C705